jgi:hypothetical protein
MAYLTALCRINPRTRAATHHTDRGRVALFTRHLPRPLGGDPRHAGRRQAAGKRLRTQGEGGRWNPYGGAAGLLSAASPILALVASVVVTPMASLPMAALGLAPLLAPGRLPAGPRPIALAPVAAAADQERPTAVTAGPPMKQGNLAHGHRSLQCRRSGQPRPSCARLPSLPSISSSRMGRGTESPGAYRGFRLWGRRGEAYPTRPEGLLRTPLPPRYARDDDFSLKGSLQARPSLPPPAPRHPPAPPPAALTRGMMIPFERESSTWGSLSCGS